MNKHRWKQSHRSQIYQEVLSDGNIDVVDELLAPNYANLSMGVTNRAGFKAVISGLKAAVPAGDFEIVNLVAEGEDPDW